MSSNNWTKKDLSGRRGALHPVVQSYASKRIHQILNFIEKPKNCLEIGAGDGFFSLELEKHFDLVISDKLIEALDENPSSCPKEVFSAEKILKPDSSFQLVFEANMLHHSEDEEVILQEMKRVSSQYIVLLEPNPYHPLTLLVAALKSNERKSLRFTMSYLRKLAHKAELDIISIKSIGLLPANKCPTLLWRLFRKIDDVLPFLGLENLVLLRKPQN
jgi:SAM-dependent methyltransferase